MIATVNSLLDKTAPTSKTSDGSETPKTGNSPEATETLDKPKTPETTERVKTAKTPKTTETAKNQKGSEPAETVKPAQPPKTPEATKTKTAKTTKTTKTTKPSDQKKEKESSTSSTLELAAHDVRLVIDQQREQSQSLTTKLNILFVTNGALFTSLTISRLLFFPNGFSLAELFGFLVNFTLLINAFLPRQLAVSPNLGDKKFLERYLVLSPDEYHLRMIVNLVETYNANKQRLEDVSSSLQYSAYVTWGLALVITLHVVGIYFVPLIDLSSFG
jgi:cobalamin biosynthesis Mg chelatase CobN